MPSMYFSFVRGVAFSHEMIFASHQTIRLRDAVKAIAGASVVGSVLFSGLSCYNICSNISDPLANTLFVFCAALFVSMIVGLTLGVVYAIIVKVVWRRLRLASPIALAALISLPFVLVVVAINGIRLFGNHHRDLLVWLVAAAYYLATVGCYVLVSLRAWKK